MKLVPEVEFEIRVLMVPSFKLQLLNKLEALHGSYEVFKRQIPATTDTCPSSRSAGPRPR